MSKNLTVGYWIVTIYDPEEPPYEEYHSDLESALDTGLRNFRDLTGNKPIEYNRTLLYRGGTLTDNDVEIRMSIRLHFK
jgi:hypothetical protein